MKSNRWLMLICITLAIFMLVPLGLAYFEYVAKYDVLINGDGSINQNAFGVLNSEDYRTPEYGYGTTPGNPFVVDSLDRLYNLIKLNNNGRLISSKISNGIYKISQYYFVLDFTEEALPQVLNLNGIITESVGNNEYPFVDQLSGLLYAYCYDTSSYIYLSGLIDPVDVVVNKSTGVVTIDGVVTEVIGSGAASGEYIKVPAMYVEFVGNDKITAGGDVYVPITSLKKIHNVIANATVEVPDKMIDVGFFSTIACDTIETSGGNVDIRASVSDVIFYNLTVNSVETEENTIKTALASVWNQIFGSHNFEDTYTYDPLINVYYERHIGLFAGHIDGDAENITVAGDCNIHIGSKDVNYYSAFTTAGYIDENAKIGGVPFSELISSGESVNDVTGCMFADSIYTVAENDPGNAAYKVISGGLTRYVLSSIPASGNWKGVGATSNGRDKSFTYGSFHFILSDNNDTVNDIWEGGSAINLLNAEGYVATQSVLYCNDEYRYNPSAQSGGSLVPGAASANETQYQGIHTLIASGSSLDKGKYIIVAKIPETVSGVTTYRYFALKIVAEVADGNQIVYSFDNSTKCEITTYITDSTGGSSIYSSALWQTSQDSTTPTFRNTRFDTQYLTVSVAGSSVTKGLTSASASAASFRCSVLNNTFTYTVTETTENGIVSTDYYLNYDTVNGFYFSTERNTIIDIYRLSNGFSIELVTSADSITENDDYLIVGKDGSDYYLLGEKILEVAGSTTVTATGTFGADYRFASMPSLWSLQDYQNFRQYIWYADSASVSGSSASVRFNEKVSGTYYLNISQGQLNMTPAEPSEPWVYNQGGNGGSLSIGIYSINFSYASATETNFSVGGSSSTIYIYKLVPDDDDWHYNTYQGARLVTYESSTVQKGSYLIGVYQPGTNTYHGLAMTGTDTSGTLGTQNISSYINGDNTVNLVNDTGTYAGYKWQVDETTATPSLRNVRYPTKYLTRNAENNATAADVSAAWRYNATSERLYYLVGTTRYYLAFNGAAFVITNDTSTPGYNYNVQLYKITYEYVYSDVQPVENFNVYSGKLYFILDKPLHTINTTASYALGSTWSGTTTGTYGAVSSVEISSTSIYNPTNKTLKTTTDLSFYRWKMEPIANNWIGYQFRNDKSNMFLAASTALQSRTLVVTPASNTGTRNTSTNTNPGSNPPTGIGLGRPAYTADIGAPNPFYNTDSNGIFTGNNFYIHGTTNNYRYYVSATETPGVFWLSLTTSTSMPTDLIRPYIYEAAGYTTSVTVAPLSERGDNLDAGIHYMITARVSTGGINSFYALSETLDENGNKQLTGINVTSQAETINNSNIYDTSGNIIEAGSTDTLRMVPVESDWLQISSEKSLQFYQSVYSTNAVREYLTVSGFAPSLASIPVTSSEQPAQWYYDAVGMYFKYYTESTVYYMQYNVSLNSFTLTNDKEQATQFYIYRFKPTYVITQVTDATEESFKYGNFIIAGYSADGYTAIGVDSSNVITANVSNYLAAGEITEYEYNEILNYILKQQYYDFSGASYNETTPILKPYSYTTGGGFTVMSSAPGLQTGSDPMSWRLTNNGSGLWNFVNNARNGNVSAGTRGISFTGSTSRLSVADTNSLPYYSGSAFGLTTDASTYSARLYTTSNPYTTLTPVTTNIAGSERVLVLVSGNNYYAVLIGNNNNPTAQTLEVININATTGVITLTTAVQTNGRLTVTASGNGYSIYRNSRYLQSNGNNLTTPQSSGTAWIINGGHVYSPATTTHYLSMNGSSVQLTASQSETLLYSVSDLGDGKYAIIQQHTGGMPANGSFIMLFHNDRNYYAVSRTAVGLNVVNIGSDISAPDIIKADMVWVVNNSKFTYTDAGGNIIYLRSDGSSLYKSESAGNVSWTFLYTSATAAFSASNSSTTPLYIFRVDMSTELDAVTDIYTTLTSKSKLTPTVSLLESSKYVIVAEVDRDSDSTAEKYYSLGMVDSNNSQSIDITDIMKNAEHGTTVTLFDTCVWEQMGSDLSLIFNNCGFTDTYYLTGVLGNRDSMEPKVIHPETPPADFTDYIWRTYSFPDGTYLFGYTEVSGGVEQVYYLYFDTADLKFKLTTSATVAKNAISVVQIYQLGVETANQPYFETAIIETEDDIIVSYPLNLAETRADLKKYAVIDPETGGTPEVQGEYLILAVNGLNYYALTLSTSGSLMYIDVSPYFSGNYSYDDNDNLCLSVNFNYIWRQMNEVTEVMYSPSLSFCNLMTGSYLGGLAADLKYDFSTHTLSYLSGSAMNYLNFSVSDGFTFGNSTSGYEILLYSLGALGTDTGDTGTLNYTYYNVPISTSLDSSVTFSDFEFNKKLIPELLNYAVGTSGFIEKSVGWSLTSAGEKLSEINSSVFFTKGYTYDPAATDTVADFAEEFSQFTSPYSIFNTDTNETLTGSCSYYAPAGTAAFVIDEASQAAPVFVNIVVSTQFDTSSGLNSDYLRYLALWRIASLTSTTGTATALKPYSGGDGTGVLDYAYTFEQKLRTPDFAIPLPNHYGTAASGASYAYVDGQGYVLSDADYNTDYLIAHTFVITKPGVYYLGSTYGSVAISYISIDNMAEGEATGGVGYGSDFSIDFCYGSVDLQETAEFDAETADGLLDSLTYVGSGSWYHSNIFPMFINGNSANPTDKLDINVVRVLDTLNNTSNVNVNSYTKARIAGGILYANNNSIAQRAVRKVNFNVYCDGLAAGTYLTDDTVFWTASKDESTDRFRLYSTYAFSDVLVNNYFLNVTPGGLSLSTAGVYYWTCDSSGHLVSQDGLYLTYSGGEFSLSSAPSDSSVIVNKYEGGTPTVSSSMTNGGVYFLTTPGGDMVVIRPEE